MATIQIPEWAIGSDKEIQIFLPLPYAALENVIVLIRCQDCPSRIEAQYSVEAFAGYISTGVDVQNLPHPDTGVLTDAVCIQIRREQSKDFIKGIKYAELILIETDEDWDDAEKHNIFRQFFASYYENKVNNPVPIV
jgi:hypothetical protein